MSFFRPRPGLRLAIALVVALAVVSVGGHVMALHGPGGLPSVDHGHDHDHGHSHDDGLDESDGGDGRGGWKPGHAHGHNGADHSHAVMGPAELGGSPGRTPPSRWERGPPRAVSTSPVFLIERPPRSAAAS